MKTFSESVEPLVGNRDPNRTQNLHVCTICFRPEVVCDVFSGRNVKTIEGYFAVNFEVASSNSFRDIFFKKLISWRRRTSTIALSETQKRFRLKTVREHHMCQWGSNRNPCAGYPIGPSATPVTPQKGVEMPCFQF